ncbi:hypothetical protein D3C72_1455490 [compost metagenome]
MTCLQQRRKTGQHGYCRGGGSHAQAATRHILQAVQFLAQHLVFAQHALGRCQHRLPFMREPHIRPPPLHDDHPELRLQGTHRIGQRWLGDVAGLRSPTKVPMFVQCHKIAQGGEQVHGQ